MKSIVQKLFIAMFFTTLTFGLSAQCPDNIIANSGFESGAFTDWWNWHDNSPDSYSFATSDDAYTGDSSAVINILEDTDVIPGGQGGEYNSRPQTNPVIGGQFYEIKFYAKSTIDGTQIPIYIKDENDGWILLHSDVGLVGTDWTEVTSLWQADTDRPDIHLEIKVYNGDFHEPYSVWLDDVTICQADVLTNTCSDNIVTNPGFEDGSDVDWWTWHGGDETDYSFETGTEGYLGNASAKIGVLKPSADLTGTGEFNSRPQESPVVADQNYRVTVWGKSTQENTIVQVWVKDEFDGWTTIGNCDLTFGTEWSEGSFVFASEANRDDVHVEIKVFNADFTEPYDVWLDEVSICATEDDAGGCGDEPTEPDPIDYGTTATITTCGVNLANEFSVDDMPNDGMGWDIWDGSDDEELSTFALDPVLPYSGSESMRIDVTENHDVAEFHHRFGNDLVLEDGQEYTVTLWMRTDVPEGDTIRAFTRAVRDTDWSSQFSVDFIGAENEWLNYTYSFTADGTWDNAFIEMKIFRVTGFTSAYSVWLDDIAICESTDAMTGLDDLELKGVEVAMSPNPITASLPVNLNIISQNHLENATIQVVDLLGRTLWINQLDIVSGEQTIEIPTDALRSGMYLVNIIHEGYAKNLKLQVIE